MRKAIVLIVAAAALALSASSFGGRNCCQPSSLGAPDYSILKHTAKARIKDKCCGPACSMTTKQAARCSTPMPCCTSSTK